MCVCAHSHTHTHTQTHNTQLHIHNYKHTHTQLHMHTFIYIIYIFSCGFCSVVALFAHVQLHFEMSQTQLCMLELEHVLNKKCNQSVNTEL